MSKMMRNQLDENFRQWLSGHARRWNKSLRDATFGLNRPEIENRWESYPNVRDALLRTPFNISEFVMEAIKCWVLRQQFDVMRFNRFVKHSRAPETIIGFIKDFSDDADAIERIDDFIEKAIKLGISKKPKGFDKAGAAQLASLILTSLYPNKFVDFRKNRWVRLAINLKYPFPYSNVTYGDWLIWAGRFANAIVRTQTYKEFWPKNKFPYFEPLWVVAGICWKEPKFHEQSSLALDTDLDWYLEGNRKKRTHLALERNRTVIQKAKDAAFKRESSLRCQICGFSFKENYGDRGDRFIEAHHKQPLGQLGAKTRTRVEDIAMVCSNCHRMLHRGERTLTIEELREITK